MTPFWIINFMEKGSVESFFESYWTAVESNSPADEKPLKFFHITDGTKAGLTKEALNDIAFKHLAMDTAEQKKLIPAFTKNQGNKISVFFIGDITQEKTIERLHTWAGYLQQKRMENLQQPWYSISHVKMYAILLRPESITIDDKVLNSRVRGFLNELHSLEKMDINNRPFDKVLFLQAPLDKTGRTAAEQSACLATYHIARTEGRCFKSYGQDAVYCDASASAVFFEANVQKEIDAYHLGCILIDNLANSQDEEFLNVKEARAFVEKYKTFTDSFKPANTKLFYISEAPHVPNLDITKFSCKLNLLNIVPIWQYYDAKHIEKVISHVTEELAVFGRDFKRSLNHQQHKLIFGNSRALLDYVFQMFCERDTEQFKHIGLQQAYSVLEQFRLKIEDAFKSTDRVPKAFELPKYLDKLLNKSKRLDLSSDSLKNELEARMEALPKIKRSILLTSLTAGVLCCSALIPFVQWWGLLMLPIAALIGAVVFICHINNSEKLKDLFVGAKLREIRAELDEHAANLQEKTVSEMKQYMKWMKEKKIGRLQNEMHAIEPPSFHFQTTKVFQPLVKSNIDTDTASQSLLSGSFGSAPLVRPIPPIQVYSEVKNATVNIYDMLNANKDAVQGLVQALMFCDEEIINAEEEQVEFMRHESVTIGHDMLLLLDVSGSMYSDMDALKKYVHDLESVGNIEWIAFDDKVVATSKETEIDNLSAGGGTCFVPAIEQAVKWLETNSYDTIILLSDGCPCESADEIVAAADGLNMPLNTIAVGGADEAMLTEIAIRTGGKEVTVDSFEQINTPDVWKNEIMPNIEMLATGDYAFGELMKHTQIDACASALRKFSLYCIKDYSLRIPVIFSGYIHEPGFDEWLDMASQRNTLFPAAAQMRAIDNFSSEDEGLPDMETMKTRISEMCERHSTSMDFQLSNGEPDMVVSLVSLRPLQNMGELQWASSMSHGDTTLNEPKMLKELMSNQGKVVNIYDEEITA